MSLSWVCGDRSRLVRAGGARRRPSADTCAYCARSTGQRGGEARLVGEHDELRPVARADLRHRAVDVRLGGERRQVEAFRDLVVAQPVRDELDDLALARGERGERLRVDDGADLDVEHLRDEGAGRLRREQRLPRGDRPDAVEQRRRPDALAEEPAGARAQGGQDVLVHLEGRQDDDLDVGELRVGGDPLGRGDPVDPGHPDVHQHHVRAGPAHRVDRVGAVADLADDLHVVRGADEGGEPRPDELLVVDDEHADRHRRDPASSRGAAPTASTGRTARTRYRSPSAPTSRAPPTARTRSRMPTRPWPPAPVETAGRRRSITSMVSVSAAWREGQLRVADSVLVGVREGLLDDAVRGQVHDRRERAGLAVGPEVDDEPGGRARPPAAGRARPAPGTGSSPGRRRVPGAPPRASRARSARSRSRPARARARRERRPGASQQRLGDPGLHADHGDVVPEHVVQLARDAQALLGDLAGGLRLAACVRPARRGPARPRSWSVATRRRTRRRARPPGAPWRA